MDPESLAPAMLRGAALSASLIIAIGAQNAFVLRQGLERAVRSGAHILPVVLICAGSDALLISAGVAGAGALLQGMPQLIAAVRWLGVAYLTWYAVTAFRRALRPAEVGLVAGPLADRSLARTVTTTLALTFLNPHVYLDTVVLLGTIAARESPEARPAFALGAIAASFSWFFALGYGARLLSPLFARPSAWRILDAAIGVMMLGLALSLVL
jgi:L-lysine exporter family protein LysE/ArgO